MFLKNEVIGFEGTTYRILEVQVKLLIWIPVEGEFGMPSWINRQVVTDAIPEDRFERKGDEYEYLLKLNRSQGSRSREIRDSAFELIHPIISNPGIFDVKQRSALIADVALKSGKSKANILRYLRRYWKRGQTKNALLPDYGNCGGKGKARAPKKKKLGRPRSFTPGEGCIVDDRVKEMMRRIIKLHLMVSEPLTIAAATRKLEKLYLKYHAKTPQEELPTERQLGYFFHQNYPKADRIEAQASTIAFDKDIRPLKSTVNASVHGPGSRYEIDATIADIYLVSSVDRSRIVGRPTVYVVVDAFSRLITGLYVGLDNPSYATAILALANSFLKKDEYCARYGIDISDVEWPAYGLPAAITADKAELLGSQIESLSEKFRIRIENPASYRADAKGIVERKFRTLQAEFKPYAPGVVTATKIKKRGGKDYRLDAKLTVDEFTEIIIECILHHNKYSVISGYDRSDDMPPNLKTTALSLWNWGLSNRTGQLKKASQENILVALLPRATVSVSIEGVKLWGMTYASKELFKSGWLHRSKKVNRPKGLIAAYDPRNTNQIYLFPSRECDEYWVCRLTDRSRFYIEMTFKEAWSLMGESKRSSAKARLKENEKHRDLTRKIEDIVSRAESHTPNVGNASNAERTRSIRQNKAEELAREQANTPILKKGRNDESVKADISPLTIKDDYSYPDMTDELFEDDD